VVSFVLVILSLPLAVSTFGLREKLSAEAPGLDSPGSATEVRATLLRLWARCLLIGFFGCLLAYGSASPAAAWPYISASAVLLALHAPRQRLIARPPP
jgi:O-antigen/teichoic acid export membrane protein